MRVTRKPSQRPGQRLAVSTEDLALLLGCGRCSAVKIGTAAGARIKIGKRVLWNVAALQRYLDTLNEDAE